MKQCSQLFSCEIDRTRSSTDQVRRSWALRNRFSLNAVIMFNLSRQRHTRFSVIVFSRKFLHFFSPATGVSVGTSRTCPLFLLQPTTPAESSTTIVVRLKSTAAVTLATTTLVKSQRQYRYFQRQLAWWKSTTVQILLLVFKLQFVHEVTTWLLFTPSHLAGGTSRPLYTGLSDRSRSTPPTSQRAHLDPPWQTWIRVKQNTYNIQDMSTHVKQNTQQAGTAAHVKQNT